MHVLIVDAVNDAANRFQGRFGFAQLTDQPTRLFLALLRDATRGSYREFVRPWQTFDVSEPVRQGADCVSGARSNLRGEGLSNIPFLPPA